MIKQNALRSDGYKLKVVDEAIKILPALYIGVVLKSQIDIGLWTIKWKDRWY